MATLSFPDMSERHLLLYAPSMLPGVSRGSRLGQWADQRYHIFSFKVDNFGSSVQVSRVSSTGGGGGGGGGSAFHINETESL